ncbi:MotA/TolQ/ExbB proton channel family protein [Entomobacter blattae]|uniref:Biopolymer transport protein ExbB n=1 Tax=Entomobacter blattae TaxID=2762277 RepID=A0A7H1NR91_9PROT|nr:MotA/TolQ/ExbB proton channel family protein [Entomobacter blattae]QNT78301.1 MotA/TolQ/ExbB proton channel family protein [Entomobacter blattae]
MFLPIHSHQQAPFPVLKAPFGKKILKPVLAGLMMTSLSIGTDRVLGLSSSAWAAPTTQTTTQTVAQTAVPSPPPPPMPAASPETGPMQPPAPHHVASPENPYGLSALWMGGDIVSRTVLIILLIMSIGTWYIMLSKFFEQGKILKAGRAIPTSFWKNGLNGNTLSTLQEGSPFRMVAQSGLNAAHHHKSANMQTTIDLYSWVTLSIQNAVSKVQAQLQTGLAFLGTVGSTAPFVGLFGTVWGIYHALTAIGIAGQATIDKVAGPVGEALIMTAIGLATAVPAVLGYNFLVRRNKVALDTLKNFGSDVQSVLLGGRPSEAGLPASTHEANPSTITSSSRVE